MRVLLSCNHIYPAKKETGAGKKETTVPSGSNHYQHDLLARGLAEQGHEVLYYVKHIPGTVAEKGVRLLNKLPDNVDLVHLNARIDTEIFDHYKARDIPVLATNHLFVPNEVPEFKWIHVSRTLARLYQQEQYVWCGLDPDDYVYSETKKDYFLFIADMSRHEKKGLGIALNLARDKGIQLVVAGSAKVQADIDKVQGLCDAYGATYVGDVRGSQKRQLYAHAKALISPSQLPETFGVTLVEALLSGTPVICSDKGAYGEIISKDVGFVCGSEEQYHEAIDSIENIDSQTCRDYAVRNFHYRENTRQYIEIYEELLSVYDGKNLTQ